MNSNDFSGIGAARLRAASEELATLAVRAEEQFLAIGGRLHGLHQRANEVSQQATEIFDLILGDQAESIRLSLQTLVERLADHLRGVLKKADQSNRTLTGLLALLDQLPEPLEGYRDISKTLQMLGISTRIESSGTEKAFEGFQLLGTELKSLEHAIGEKVDRILSRLKSLYGLCRDARDRVTSIESSRTRLIGQGDGLAQSVLAAVAEKNRLTAEKTKILSDRSREITAGIGEIVTSLQYQDITRQQIDHVRVSLEEISQELIRVNDGGSARPRGELLQVVGEVCRLQSAQLIHSRDELDAAIEQIFESLQDVSLAVTAIAQDMRYAAGSTQRDGSTVFSGFEEAIRKISATLGQELSTTHEADRVIGSVLSEAHEMSTLVDEINRVGLEMKVIALNAGINATNVGGGLPALEVIAGGTQRLARRVVEQTEIVASGLKSVISASDGLGASAPGLARNTSLAELEDLSQESSVLLHSLQALYETLVTKLGDLESTSHSLAADVANTASAFTIHTDSRQTIDTVVADLTKIGQSLSRTTLPTDEVLDDGYLQLLRERFTMQSERDIFDGKTVSSDPDERLAKSDPHRDLPADNDFGANVEFF